MITLLITIVLKIKTLLLNESIKRISISISNNSSIILELCNSFTPIKLSPFIWIPSSVSDGMSNSDSIINHYSPISLCLYPGNSGLLLWIEIEKEDLINQPSLLFILFIINSFHSIMKLSPSKVPLAMDWIRSHSSFFQLFILRIISRFDLTVSLSPNRVPLPRVMNWSRGRSHSSFIQLFILSNTTEWHSVNALSSSWMNIREGRFFNSNDSYQ